MDDERGIRRRFYIRITSCSIQSQYHSPEKYKKARKTPGSTRAKARSMQDYVNQIMLAAILKVSHML